jgi:hypothetical protein
MSAAVDNTFGLDAFTVHRFSLAAAVDALSNFAIETVTIAGRGTSLAARSAPSLVLHKGSRQPAPLLRAWPKKSTITSRFRC